MPADSFRDLVDRVRAGDGDAAAELVRRYEPAVRCAARVRLGDPRLGRILDSMDICQSVLGSFFFRAALGQYELETPEQLMRLLATMARNKVANKVNAQRAAVRDYRRATSIDDGAEVVGREASPSRYVSARELLDKARGLFQPTERDLLERREKGDSWDEIAAELRCAPDTLRQRLARAIDRVARELDVDEDQP